MRPNLRNTVFTIATLGALVACASDTIDEEATDRRKRDAGVQAVDSGSGTTSPDASTSSSGGTVSCYTEGAPTNTCTLPIHCCFFNYSSQHNGSCETSSCSWGTIDCDGPEDCATGQHCCSTQLRDSNDEPIGYRLACQSNACGSPPLHEELCHSSATCANGGNCVNTYGLNNDLPRSLYLCR